MLANSTGISSASTLKANEKRLSTISEEDPSIPAAVGQTTKPRPFREDLYSSRSKTSTTTKVFNEVGETQCMKLSRLAHGDLGDVIKLKTNCFKVDLDSKVQLYIYHVHITPEPETAREHQRAFELFLKEGSCLDESRSAGATEILVTNHRNTVVTVRPLKLGRSHRGQCQVGYYESEDTRPKKIPSTNIHVFTISLTKTQPMSLTELMACFGSTSAQASFGRIESTVQLLNIAMSRKPVSFLGVIEPNSKTDFFNKWGFVLGPLDGGLVAQACHSGRIINAGPSFFANIIPRIGSFYEAGPLIDLIRAFRSSGRSLHQLHGFLKGVRVEVSHLRTQSGRNRVKTITGLAQVPKLGANANETRFVWENEEICVADYYWHSKYLQCDHTHFAARTS